MYIGPWQEYALYRARTQKSSLERKNASDLASSIPGIASDKIRQELEKALINSLDEESAKKAVSLMANILESTRSSVSIEIDRSQRAHKHASSSNIPARSSSTTLPSINSAASANSDPLKITTYAQVTHLNTNATRVGSPMSSLSDPLPAIHRDRPPIKRLINSSMNEASRSQSNDADVDTSHPTYDSIAAARALRHERLLKRLDNDAASTWKWASGNKQSTKKDSQAPSNPVLEGRLKQLNKMKKLYIAHNSKLPELEHVTSTQNSLTDRSNPIHEKPLAATQYVESSQSDNANRQILDMELTPVEIGLVSKYFDFLNVPSENGLPNYQGKKNEDMVNKDLNTRMEPRLEGTNSENKARTVPRPIQTAAIDELGGIDSLINWSLSLQSIDPI